MSKELTEVAPAAPRYVWNPFGSNIGFDFLRQCYGHGTSRGAIQSSWGLNDKIVRLLCHGSKNRTWKNEIDMFEMGYQGSSSGGGWPGKGNGWIINTLHRDNIVFNKDATAKPGQINVNSTGSASNIKCLKRAQTVGALYDPEGFELDFETSALNGDRAKVNADSLFFWPYGGGGSTTNPVGDRLYFYCRFYFATDNLADLKFQLLEYKDDWYSGTPSIASDVYMADRNHPPNSATVKEFEAGPISANQDFPYKVLRIQIDVARYGAPYYAVYAAHISQAIMRTVQ